MDRCTVPQQRLRTLLGTHLFNAGDISTLVGWSVVSTLTHYTITMSPRFDDLVLVADCPTNVLGYLVPEGDGTYVSELPGLRLSDTDGQETYRLIHLPTGARMTVTGQPRTVFDRSRFVAEAGMSKAGRKWWTPDVPLARAEEEMLRFNPVPPDCVARIIQALVVRLSAHDPRNMWAMGYWFYDPLRRPNLPSGGRTLRRLIGAGPNWQLQWTGYPHLTDIVAMLTDDVFGLHGVTVESTRHYVDLNLDGETLRLQAWLQE